MTIQALEILEKSLINFQQGDFYKKIISMETDIDNFKLREFEYSIVQWQLADINTVTLKLINLMNCLHNNWTDFAKTGGNIYDYRGSTIDSITTEEIVEFANIYFDTRSTR